MVDEEIQLRVRNGGGGTEDGLIPLPFAVETCQRCRSEFAAASVGQGGAKVCRSVATNISRKAVLCAVFDAHAAKAGVPEAVTALVDARPQVVRVGGVQRVVGANIEFAFRGLQAVRIDGQNLVPARERFVEFKGSILDEFGVEPAVGSEVDVFEKDAEHLGRDGRAGVSNVDVDESGALLCVAPSKDQSKTNEQHGAAKISGHRGGTHYSGVYREGLRRLMSIQDNQLSRRSILLGSAAALPLVGANGDQGRPALTAGMVIERIKTSIGIAWRQQTVDNLIAGAPDTPVRGIATTMMATLDVCKRAHAAGKNMIITHESTFFSHQDAVEQLQGDETYLCKRDFLNSERHGGISLP